MKTNIRHLIDFARVDTLLEGFNKSTGFVTAILDLEGNVLSKSGWRTFCTEFHRLNPETSKRCTISDTVLANKMEKGDKYHAYKCLNGLMDVVVPLNIRGVHVANLFSGQFFFEKPDVAFFRKQAKEFGFDEEKYLDALSKVPIVSEEKVKTAMDFLLDMTQLISDLTIQKLEQAELNQDLKDSEQKFKSLFESANAGKSIILPSGEINVNQAFCEMLGYTRLELENKKWQGITHEEDIPISKKIFESLMAGEKDSDRFEKRYLCKNGSYIWADVSVSILRDENGELLHFITTIIDITERKRTDEALKLSESRLNRALENIPDVVVIYDKDLKIQYINAATLRISGHPMSDFIGKREEEIWPPEVYQIYMPMLQESFDTGEVRSMDTELTFPNGDIRSLGITCVPLLDEKGAVREVMGVTTDFTDRKMAEQAVRESEEKFFTLFEKSPFAVTLSKLPDGTFIAVNEAFEREFGFTKHEALGKNSKDLGINPDAEGRKRILEALKESNSVRNQEMVLLSKSGEKNYYLTNIDKVFINGEECLINTTQNISEYNRAKNKLKENYDLIRIAGEKAKLGGWNVILKENRSYWSDEVAAIHEMPAGYSPLVNDGINFYAPEWRDKITEVFGKCAQEGNPYDEEMEIITATGKRVWVRTIGEAVSDENGNIFKIQGAFQDITLKKQAEEELKDSEARYKAIFESTGTATLIVEEDSTILLANNECFEMFGYDPAQLFGQKWPRFVAPESVQEMLENHQLRRKNPELAPRKYEVKLLNSTGEKRDVVLNINMIPGTKQSVVSMLDITERKKAEKELKKSKSNLEEYFENDISANYVVSVSGEIFSCNKTFLNLFGFEKRSDTERFNITELFKNPNDREQMLSLIRKHGKVENYELNFISKEGKTIYALINALGIFDKENKLEKIRGYVVDITEQKRAQIALHESEVRYREFFEADISGYYIATTDGIILDCNPAFIEILGYGTAEEIIDRNISEIYQNPAERQNFLNLIKNQKTLRGYISILKRKDGASIICNENIVGKFDANGKMVQYFGYMYDITDKMHAEEELRKNEQLLASVMDTQQELICRFLPDTTLTFINKAYCKIFGKKEEELLGQKFLQLVPESEWEDILSNLKRLNKENPQITYESSGFKADGSVMLMEWTDIAIFNERLEVVEFQSVGRDITEKIKTLYELIVAKEKAEEGDKLKTAFINNISHEIRTPLNGILGFGKLLAEPELSAEKRIEFFELVNQSSNRLVNTVTDYMDMAMIVSGTMEIHKKEFVLQPFFKDTAKTIEQLCVEKNIVFYTELPPESPFLIINSDPEFIRKILDKLFDNAIKFTKEGYIRYGYIVKTGHVEFFVKDTGCGIDNENPELIFEMFRQVDTSTTRGYEGSGLGLTIAKGMAALLGGEIHVDSAKYKGAVFTLTIPLNNPENSILTEATNTINSQSNKNPLILIAEDDKLNFEYLSAVLDLMEYKYIQAVNGVEAVEFCRQNPGISLILMDIKMPLMNGVEASKQIRQFRPELPIIAITAYAQTGDEYRFLADGFNDYVAKPVKSEKISSLIRKYVE